MAEKSVCVHNIFVGGFFIIHLFDCKNLFKKFPIHTIINIIYNTLSSEAYKNMGKHSLLENIHLSESPLNDAVSLQDEAAKIGFDWPDISYVFAKLHEEINELQAEIPQQNNHAKILDEFGDVLFVCTNLARHLKVNPEHALQHANKKFIRRFKAMEQLLLAKYNDLSELDLNIMDEAWDEVKKQEK